MKDFDSLQDMWQQPTPAEQPLTAVGINKHSKTLKMKLQKQQLGGAILLILTAVLIAAVAIFLSSNFTHWYTYCAMGLMCLVCLAQAGLMYSLYKKIIGINETIAPAAHLQQWETYYDLRKKQNKWNMPLYYVLLNVAMGIYLAEVFTGRPLRTVLLFTGVYLAWMLFAYFYLGKRNIRKEDQRLNSIVGELKIIASQLKNPA